jgi:DNA-binding GntR family transcriptional regulator
VGGRIRLENSGLHNQAARKIRDMIVRGVLAPGTMLEEVAICEALGVSRTPLREALKLLAAEGLVELRRNRTARVSQIDAENIGDLFEVASGIERMAAELAATRISKEEIARLKKMQSQMVKYLHGEKLDRYFELNQKIHSFIVDCAKNQVLKSTHEWLLPRIARARYMALYSEARWRESVVEHEEILSALESNDPVRAGTLLGKHVWRTGELVKVHLADHHETIA